MEINTERHHKTVPKSNSKALRDEFLRLQSDTGLTCKELASFLCISNSTVLRWRSGERPVPAHVIYALLLKKEIMQYEGY